MSSFVTLIQEMDHALFLAVLFGDVSIFLSVVMCVCNLILFIAGLARIKNVIA